MSPKAVDPIPIPGPNSITMPIIGNIVADTKPPKKGSLPSFITINGNVVKMSSGKSSWSSIGHAKSAWNNHIHWRFYHMDGINRELIRQELNIPEDDDSDAEIIRQFTNLMVQMGILKFVQSGGNDEHQT
jgi:hypothetical protein